MPTWSVDIPVSYTHLDVYKRQSQRDTSKQIRCKENEVEKMLFQREKKAQELRKNCRDGEGAVLFEAFCQAESLPKPYRMYSEAV